MSVLPSTQLCGGTAAPAVRSRALHLVPEAQALPTVVGADLRVPTLAGELPYANLDHAASTPALTVVKEAVDRVLETYSSVHRGAGYASRLTSAWYEQARTEEKTGELLKKMKEEAGRRGNENGAPGQQGVEGAKGAMQRAERNLRGRSANRGNKDQKEAIERLEKAKEELEEILRQLREEEQLMLLEALERRFEELSRLIADPAGGSLSMMETRVDQPMIAAIGPEGGFSPAELAAAQSAGWRAVSLGERILRVETAAIAMAAWAALAATSDRQ